MRPLGKPAGARRCDQLISECVETMVAEGASLEVVLDRILTFAAGQACALDGAFNSAAVFRSIADQIEGGLFSHLEPVGKRGH